jgi:transcriptional regulator with XRE-family HTH domain
MKSINEKFGKLLSSEKSKWFDEATWRIENEKWLDISALIALRILMTLDEQNMTQKQLAEKLGISPQQVNKIVKGSENLTLETISKLETALDITLIDIPGMPRNEYFPKETIYPTETESYGRVSEPKPEDGKRE